MNEQILWAFVATLGTWGLTALGAATVLFFRSCTRYILDSLLGFSSGVMMAASFWSLLLPAVERAGDAAWVVVTGGFLAGALFLWAADKAVLLAKQRYGVGGDRRRDRIGMLVLSITLHNIPEGLAVGVAFGALTSPSNEGWMGAVAVAVGIGLQNFPEGAAVSLPLRREGVSRFRSFFWGQASGMVEPIAGVIGAWLVLYVQTILPFALSFAAGAMMLVAVHELIPECQRERDNQPYLATAGIVFGFAVMTLLDVALG